MDYYWFIIFGLLYSCLWFTIPSTISIVLSIHIQTLFRSIHSLSISINTHIGYIHIIIFIHLISLMIMWSIHYIISYFFFFLFLSYYFYEKYLNQHNFLTTVRLSGSVLNLVHVVYINMITITNITPYNR